MKFRDMLSGGGKVMTLRQVMSAVGLMVAVFLAPVKAAHADMIVYDGFSLFQGQQAFTDSFTVTTPGTLTATVTAIPWLDTVTDLSFFLSSATGSLGSTMTGGGTESMKIGAPGTYSASWFGNAQGLFDLGVVGVNIEFTPYATTVSLPASIVLMLSGLGLLFAWPRFASELPARRSADNCMT
jgi:hypothetical protein